MVFHKKGEGEWCSIKRGRERGVPEEGGGRGVFQKKGEGEGCSRRGCTDYDNRVE